MPIDETVLYDEFARARQEAVELTDRYREAPSDAPDRDALWDQVVRRTETARSLLESLLDCGSGVSDQDQAPVARIPATVK
ncbi:MAG TPA: hypothetical protein VKV73_19125 [Chloroflexota bacterium]|nr:hypothetical protein [Chloroflexota bacterium]